MLYSGHGMVHWLTDNLHEIVPIILVINLAGSADLTEWVFKTENGTEVGRKICWVVSGKWEVRI